VATKQSDNEEERIARIDALIEEYRLKHEDLQAYIEQARELARLSRERTRQSLTTARRYRSKRR
jgi:hypothetical protein